MRFSALALLLASPLALANAGSWNSQSFGGTLMHGQQWMKSKPVAPAAALPKRAVATRISWKITADGMPPPGFKIKLCSSRRCLTLPSLSGDITPPGSIPAEGPWRFEYYSAARGPLLPVLTILSNQLSVQYRTER